MHARVPDGAQASLVSDSAAKANAHRSKQHKGFNGCLATYEAVPHAASWRVQATQSAGRKAKARQKPWGGGASGSEESPSSRRAALPALALPREVDGDVFLATLGRWAEQSGLAKPGEQNTQLHNRQARSAIAHAFLGVRLAEDAEATVQAEAGARSLLVGVLRAVVRAEHAKHGKYGPRSKHTRTACGFNSLLFCFRFNHFKMRVFFVFANVPEHEDRPAPCVCVFVS